MFAGVNEEGVEFVEESMVGGEVLLKEGAKLLVGMFGRGEAVTLEDAACIGVNDEDGMAAGIEEDGVSGFRTDAVDREEPFAELFRGGAEHLSKRTAIVFLHESGEGFELASFLAKVTGRTDEARETRRGNGEDGAERKQFLAAKISDGALDVSPGSVLGENGADDDFKAGAAGPPMLRPMYGEEGFVIFSKHRQGTENGK